MLLTILMTTMAMCMCTMCMRTPVAALERSQK